MLVEPKPNEHVQVRISDFIFVCDLVIVFVVSAVNCPLAELPQDILEVPAPYEVNSENSHD